MGEVLALGVGQRRQRFGGAANHFRFHREHGCRSAQNEVAGYRVPSSDMGQRESLVPKENKPRHSALPTPEAEAADYIASFTKLSDITEVTHFSDGSMSIVYDKDGRSWHLGIEFNPPFTAAISRYLIANEIEVRRG